jgi:cytochrome c553
MKAATALVLAFAAGVAGAMEEMDLQSACLDCHQPGQSAGEVPLIAGQQRDYLRNQLSRFRDRHRDGFPMTGLAAGFDDAALDELADALAADPWQSANARVDDDAVVAGQRRADALACSSCHGDGFLGTGDIPRVAGQQPGYLARQLRAFGEGRRYHPPTGAGGRMYALTSDDASALAAYLYDLGAGEDEGNGEDRDIEPQ